jgi:hypothetical protein
MELVGALIYLATITRLDIAYPVSVLSMFNAGPTSEHWTVVKALLRYLAGTAGVGIVFGLGTGLVGYSDADYAGELEQRRSTGGYVFMLHGGSISWASKLQAMTALSTTEAEYQAVREAVKEALWFKKLLKDMDCAAKELILWCDNQPMLKLIKLGQVTTRTKRFELMHHGIRQRIAA